MRNNIRKTYIKNLKRSLIYMGKTEKLALNTLNREIELYMNEDTTYDDLVNHFGKPEELAYSFMEEYDNAILKRKASLKHIFTIIGVVLIIIITIILIMGIYESIKSRNSYITREVEVITGN